VFLNGEVNDAVSALVCAQLLFLEADNPNKPIHLYINSPGGVVTSGFAMYDTMRYIKAPVHTVCMGTARSMGSFLLMAGEPGERVALPNASLHVHQPLGGFQGQASDILIHAEEMLKTKRQINPALRRALPTQLRGGRAHPRSGSLHDAGGSSGMGIDRPHSQAAGGCTMTPPAIQ